MKNWIQTIGFVALALISNSAQAQQEVNTYGPPRYTGGTTESPNEAFALYYHNLQAGIRDYSSPGIQKVYPNPATVTARIVLERSPAANTLVSVFNTNGVLVKSYKLNPGTISVDLDVSNLPPGIYSLQIQEEGKEAQSVQLSKY